MRLRAPTIVPLVLHRVVPGRPTEFADITIPTLETILERVGADWVSLEGEYNPARKGRGLSWLLTFDDGYASDYEIVFPRLKTQEQQAYFFLIADRIGTPGYLTWEQVREMRRHGMAFGAHGLSHRNMTRMPEEEARREFAESRARIEQNSGASIRAFSFPFGYHTPGLIRMAREAGFDLFFTSDHGMYRRPLCVVPRNSINGCMDDARIAKIMEASTWTRFAWRAEDIAKKAAKRLLGETAYKKMRQHVVG